MEGMERRYTQGSVELRKDEDGKFKGGSGLAAVFNKLSENLGGFREKIAPGAFDGVLEDDVRVLRDHEPGKILGRTKAGTANVSITADGLAYSWKDPDTTYSRDLQKSLERGDITQSSFGFIVEEDEWSEDEEGRTIRTIKKVRELFDVSPVTFPAYPDATVAKRGLEAYQASKITKEKKDNAKAEDVKAEADSEVEHKQKKKMSKVDVIKNLEDEKTRLLEESQSILSDLEDGQGNTRSFTIEEKDVIDANTARVEEIDHELKQRRFIASQKGQSQDKPERKPEPKGFRGFQTGINEKTSEQKEVRKFDFMKFLKEVRDGQLSGFEKELHQEGISEYRSAGCYTANGRSGLIPTAVLKGEFRDITAGTVASPGEAGKAIQENVGSWIDKLYASLGVTQAGADFQTGLVGNIKWPADNAVATGTWEGEQDAGAESAPTVTNVAMEPKRVGTFVNVSNQALIQTSPSVGNRVQNQLVQAIAQAVDVAAINGSGSDPVPEGILQTTGIGAVALGTDGAAMTWDDIVDLEREVAIDNALMGNLSYLTNSKAYASLKKIKKDAGSGIYLIDSLMGEGAASLNGHRVVISNNVPSDLTKGMGSALSAVIFGNFNDLVVGQWGGIEVLVDPYTSATTATTRFIINSFFDVAVLRAQSFAAIQDAVTT